MQRVTPNFGDTFGPLDKAPRDAFITSLFQGLIEVTLGRGVTRLTVKQAGLYLPDL